MWAADRADIRSAGGSGAGLFLLPPEEESHVMSDAHLAAALRRRLRFPSAACRVAPTVPSHCNHRPRTGGICGAQLDALDFHAGTCECGGGVIQRHNAIRDWLEAWIARLTSRPTATEEYVVAWNRPVKDAAGQPVWEEAAPGPYRLEGAVLVDAQGYPVDADGYRVSRTTGERVQKVERAKLDVAFIDGEGRRAYADVAVTSAATTSAANLAKRARTDGSAASDMVRSKHSK